ncbi:MAG TPA: alpha/beta hydrolase [Abditibacterium sp.]|jgi:acetyl esterase/lipase
MRCFVSLLLLLWIFPARAEGENSSESGTQIHRDIPFVQRGKRKLRLHLLRPAKLPKTPLPIVLWVHGGLWRSGSPDKIPPLLFELARQGFACASVEFRSSEEAIFPAPLDDLRAATRFLRQNARGYSLDGAQIGVAGVSTGAHLASLLGLSGAVQAVVNKCGPSDLTTLQNGSRLDWNEEDGPLFAFLGGAARENLALARAASPCFRVSAKAPPFLILHGDSDSLVPLSQSEKLFQKLKMAGAYVTYRIYRGEEHGLRGVSEQTDAETILFFRTWLQKTRGKLKS